MEDVQAGVM
jgi:hypothetical protein